MTGFSFSLSRFYLFVLICICSFHVSVAQEVGHTTVEIPEPLMFDLVRGLGAKKGELEINTLADFPINNASFRGVEWAPEIEYALFDNFAVELEFPMNDFELEALKAAVQWTIGASKNDKFIHGVQVIAENYIHEDLLEMNFLYVPAYRFNETWSAIGLFGIMLESGADAAQKKHTILINASVFADLNKRTVVGLEINNTDPTFQGLDDNEMELLVLPQLHYELNNGFSFQFGFGAKWYDSSIDGSGVLRVIKTF
ncbi:hypothetical protein [Flavicella marina]|uniref:hypothetical protein n=1 Tax=Flavicella marina TaxID=1475951 RepID=UPI0012652203|nr:hypothetical protein [Flavicella marina]